MAGNDWNEEDATLKLLRVLLTRWSSFRLVLALIALLAGIDDALELMAGVADIFHLDTHHGVMSLALLSLSKSINDAIDEIAEAKESIKRAKEVLSQ